MINMIASIVSFLVSLGISFFVAPFIIKNIGMEANGFVALANSFINYVSILVIALNSMAGRFITIAIHKGDKDEANKYFTSIVFANIIVSLALLVPAIFLVLFLHNIINIPPNLVTDVKILFALMFLTYMLSIIGTSFSVATFATNRLDLAAKRNIEANILRAIVIFLMYRFLPPFVFYIGIISLIVAAYINAANVYYTKKLLPDIKVKKIYFDLKKIFEIIKAGFWNSISKLSQILTDGLDLLITNLFINPLAMGHLALAKLLPMIISNLNGTISSIFQPKLTEHYAKEDDKAFVKELNFAMKVSGFFTNIPLSFICVFGYAFFALWIPGENIGDIYILLLLTVIGIFVSGVIAPLWGVYTITNKLKINALVGVGIAMLNIGLIFVLLQFTNLGVFAIAMVSGITSIVRSLIFTPIYAAYCLNKKKTIFYPVLLRYLFVTILMVGTFYSLSIIVEADTWFRILAACVLCGIIGLLINYLLFFNQEERSFFTKGIVAKIKSMKTRGAE